jgi:hypothetical protein
MTLGTDQIRARPTPALGQKPFVSFLFRVTVLRKGQGMPVEGSETLHRAEQDSILAPPLSQFPPVVGPCRAGIAPATQEPTFRP